MTTGQKNPAIVHELLASLEAQPAVAYELLFHASFADHLFGVLQKAGPESEGFSRMQQTFGEAVEKVRVAISRAVENGFTQSKRYTELTAQAMSNLLELMHDLALEKHAQRAR